MKRISVLIADDDADLRDLMQIWLTKAGQLVKCVTNADKARGQLKDGAFDLFVCDVRMPGGDALQLIRDTSQKAANVRVLAISGGGQFLKGGDCVKLAQDMGAHRVLVKPFSEQEFLAAVNQCVSPHADGTAFVSKL